MKKSSVQKSTEEIFLQEERLCERKVNYKRYHIDYSRYHRSRHERGVQFYELCDNRQGAADYLRNYHGADHRRRNDEIDGNSAGGEEEHSADVDRCEGQSADKCDSYLFEYDFKIVLRPYLAERKSADYQRRNLISGVSARVHEHGYAGRKPRDRREHVFVVFDYLARERSRNHEHQKPEYSVLCELENACFEVVVVRGMKHRHLLEVLGVLVFDDVNDVVDGDYADEPRLVVNNGNGEQVVFSCDVRNVLLVVERVDAYELGVGVHYVADKLVVLCRQQRVQGDGADKMALVVDAKAGVDGLLVDGCRADMLNGLTDREEVMQLDHLDSHYRACAVFGIFQKSVYKASCLSVRLCEHAAHDVCRHLLEEVDGVIKKHIVEQAFKLGIGYQIEKLRLRIGLKIRKNVRRYVFRQDAEYSQQLVCRERFHSLRYINDV